MYQFPRVDSQSHLNTQAALVRNRNLSTISLASRFSTVTNRATALETYDLVYGNAPHLSPDVVDRVYEMDAGAPQPFSALARTYCAKFASVA